MSFETPTSGSFSKTAVLTTVFCMSETTNMVESLPKILSIIVIYKLRIVQQHQSTHIKKEKKYSIFALPVVICALGNTGAK